MTTPFPPPEPEPPNSTPKQRLAFRPNEEVMPGAAAAPYQSQTFQYLNKLGPEVWSWLTSAAAAAVVLVIALGLQLPWLGLPAAIATVGIAGRVLWPILRLALNEWLSRSYQLVIAATLLTLFGLGGVLWLSGLPQSFARGFSGVNWDAVGALAEAFGALGQISVAFLALYVAWRQYVISKDLTSQQNRITQQQTIDAYFQGISDLVLDEEGLLEDWPPERAIAEGRTAAILTGLDAEGKAKVIRFLSSAKLLTPLRRDRRLGRPIFDGLGGYEEDIEYGVRVIDLTNMLVGTQLSGTDLRSTELSEANLSGVDLSDCDLTRANLTRSILAGTALKRANVSRTRFFLGTLENASPRDRLNPPNFTTGAYTGAVVEGADFSQVKELSEEQRYYCCAWGGNKTRSTIPGGCEGIPNRLGR